MEKLLLSAVSALFDSVAFESSERIYKTKEEKYKLKKGDLVLLPRVNNDKRVDFAVIAIVYKQNGDGFYALRHELRILHRFNCGYDSVLPSVSGPIGGCEYLMEKAMVEHPPKDAYLVFGPKYLTDNRICVGLENVMRFLLETPGFEPHAGSLAIMRSLKKRK